MTEGTKDIESVAPVGEGGERVDFTKREELAGVPLELRDFRGPFDSSYGEFHVFSAVRLDTGEEVAFTGATVLDKQGRKCKEGNHFPVNAMLVKQQGGKHSFWTFVSPENGK